MGCPEEGQHGWRQVTEPGFRTTWPPAPKRLDSPSSAPSRRRPWSRPAGVSPSSRLRATMPDRQTPGRGYTNLGVVHGPNVDSQLEELARGVGVFQKQNVGHHRRCSRRKQRCPGGRGHGRDVVVRVPDAFNRSG